MYANKLVFIMCKRPSLKWVTGKFVLQQQKVNTKWQVINVCLGENIIVFLQIQAFLWAYQ